MSLTVENALKQGQFYNMKRLFAVTVVMCLFFGVMVAGCVLYGRSQPTPDVLAGYGIERCGTTWCFRGVTLGSTSWTDALASLGYPQNTVGEKVALTLPDNISANASLYFASDQFPVRHLLITFPDMQTAPTLGQIIMQYGPPCVINMGYARTYIGIVLRYPSMTFVGRLNNAHTLQDDNVGLSSQTSISSMWLSDTRENDCRPEMLIQSDDLTVFSVYWQGFQSLSLYRAHYITRNSN